MNSTGILERDLLEVRGLVESMADRYRGQVSGGEVVTKLAPEAGGFREAAAELSSQAVQRVAAVLAGRPERVAVAAREVERVARSGPRGPKVRVLVAPSAYGSEAIAALRVAGGELRLTDLSGVTILIADSQAALVCDGTGEPSLLHGTSVVANFLLLFESAWRPAAVPTEFRGPREKSRGTQFAQVLACLREGLIDEVAARRLAMSVRTYRRHVSDLMVLLGTSSRFQAGVRAIETGLLPRGGREEKDRPGE